jgi:predicted DNA-binding protein with PD1-like motif
MVKLLMYYSKCNVGYVLRIEIGEEIEEAFRQFAEVAGIKGAFYQGIGTLNQVELAFFCTNSKNYDRKFFDGEYELVSLMGNLSIHNGVVVPHTHVTLADSNFQTISGHLVRGIVSVTAEIILTVLDLSLTRKEDPILKYKGLISPKRTQLKVDV